MKGLGLGLGWVWNGFGEPCFEGAGLGLTSFERVGVRGGLTVF